MRTPSIVAAGGGLLPLGRLDVHLAQRAFGHEHAIARVEIREAHADPHGVGLRHRLGDEAVPALRRRARREPFREGGAEACFQARHVHAQHDVEIGGQQIDRLELLRELRADAGPPSRSSRGCRSPRTRGGSRARRP
jgi:hypothetical protein